MASFVEKTGVVKFGLNAISAMTQSVGGFLKESFGSPLDAANAKFNRLSGELKELQTSLENAKKGNEGWFSKIFGGPDIALIEERISKIKAELSGVKEERARLEALEPKKEAEKLTKPVDLEAQKLRLMQESKFNSDLLQMTASRIKSQQEVETNAVLFNQSLADQRLVIEQQFEAKIKELKLQGEEGKTITASQAAKMIEQIEAEKVAKLKAFDLERQDAFLNVYNNQVKAAQNAAQGIQAAFAQGGMQAQRNLQDFGKLGNTVFNAVQGGASRFFKGLGEGSKDAGSLMREFLFGRSEEHTSELQSH